MDSPSAPIAMPASSAPSMHVVVAADERYVMPLAVTVRSLLGSLGAHRRLFLHVLDGGISERSRGALAQSWLDDRVVIHWLTPDIAPLNDLPAVGHVSRAAYFRLLIPTLMPADLDRVIYLDADMLVCADIGELWDEPFHGVACLAVQDVSAPWIDAAVVLADRPRAAAALKSLQPVPNYRELGLLPGSPYLNSGVLVMNLAAWRRDGIHEQALDCLRLHRRHVQWWDQYAINVALHGRWRPLDLAWNQGADLFAYPEWRRSPFDLETLARCRFDPKIVHFTTELKPWLHGSRHPFAPQFFEVLDRTAWAGWRPRPPLTDALAGRLRSWARAVKRRLAGCPQRA